MCVRIVVFETRTFVRLLFPAVWKYEIETINYAVPRGARLINNRWTVVITFHVTIFNARR